MTLPVVFTANGPSGYNLTKSLRFRSSASATLSRTPGSASNQQKWTLSAWVKRGIVYDATLDNYIFGAGSSGSNRFLFGFSNTTENLSVVATNSGSNVLILNTTPVYRDPSAWYHMVLAVDTTQATAANRVILYVNGLQVTAFSTATYPSQNTNLVVNATNAHAFGSRGYAASDYYDGEMAEINFVDGQQLTPSSFGSTNALTGVWQPAKYTGTYGTNGFYLKFTDTTSTSTLGTDYSGNSNTWTVNNISLTAGATYDSMTDVPTLTSATTANYCVLNPLSYNGSTLSNANLLFAGANLTNARATFAMPSSGLFYWEVTPTTSMPNYVGFGLIADTVSGTATAGVGATGLWGVYPSGNLYTSLNGTGQTNTGVTTPALGCTFAVAYDCSTGKLWLGYASSGAGSITWIGGGSPASGTSPTGTISTTSQLFPFLSSNNGTGDKSAINFGQQPFTYTPPSGYVALNTYNLSTPTVGSTSSTLASKNFDINLYTGTSLSQSITNAQSFQPSMIWFKSRSNATNNVVHDVLRGTAGINRLFTDTNGAQATTGDGFLSINSNGFSLDSTGGGGDVNTITRTYVAWQWAGPSSGTTNTSGSITSSVAANTTSGFSVVTYTGTGSAATIGHGLGVAPQLVITKRTDVAAGWAVYHVSVGNTSYLELNASSTPTSSSTMWNNTTPTSSVFSTGGNGGSGSNGNTYVAYCWTPITGFSAFGSYTGNGSSDGPFIYTGFRPKYVMVKRTDTGGDWRTQDGVRNPYNATNSGLWANIVNAENTTTGYNLDLVSNGFKYRNSNADSNASGGTYIYMAFAENPFKYSLAR